MLTVPNTSRCGAFVIATLLLCSCSSEREHDSDAATPLAITYIASEGFLIAANSSKILIDALQHNPWNYDSTPDSVFEMMLAGQAPFDDVDLMIASHDHGDHFNAGLVYPYLSRHPEISFISSALAVSALTDSAGDGFDGIREQVQSVNPDWGSSAEVSVTGIQARFLTLNHAPPGNDAFLTLGSLIELEGRRILHLADLAPETTVEHLEAYGLEELEIDIAFADPYFLLNEIGQRLMRDFVKPTHIVVMHLRQDQREEMMGQVREIFPDAVEFVEALETKVFP